MPTAGNRALGERPGWPALPSAVGDRAETSMPRHKSTFPDVFRWPKAKPCYYRLSPTGIPSAVGESRGEVGGEEGAEGGRMYQP